MQVEKTLIGNYQGQDVYSYKIVNDQQNYIEIFSYAVTWHSFVMNGKNLLVHFDQLADYFGTPTYLCQAVGRVAGRITGGKVTLNNQNFQLPQNEGENTLHGGPSGFSAYNWPAKIIQGKDKVEICFSKKITSADDGFPNGLDVEIIISFDNLNQVRMIFKGKANGTTIFNPTNHVYFNLNVEQANLSNHKLQIASSQRLELNHAKLPTGNLLDNSDSGYDFSTSKNLLESLTEIKQNELDDAFVISTNKEQPVATLSNQATNEKIQIFSNRQGLVVYTADFNNDGVFDALALEAQSLPDAVNHPEWGENTVLTDGQSSSAEIVYKLSLIHI